MYINLPRHRCWGLIEFSAILMFSCFQSVGLWPLSSLTDHLETPSLRIALCISCVKQSKHSYAYPAKTRFFMETQFCTLTILHTYCQTSRPTGEIFVASFCFWKSLAEPYQISRIYRFPILNTRIWQHDRATSERSKT